MKIHYWHVYHKGGDPLIPPCVTSNQSFDLFIKPGLNSALVVATLFICFRLNCAVFKKKINHFEAVNRKNNF